jgi:hypothetical protein
MRERTSKWLVVLGATAIGLGVSANGAAQPRAADAGIPSTDGGIANPSVTADAGASPALSAPAASPAAVADGGSGAAADPDAGPTLAPPPTFKKNPPPPPPTPEQVAALATLQGAADAYERSARDYRDTVTAIIKLHYEAKKQDILSGLDKEIVTEKVELRKARDVAIARLEEFVTNYSGKVDSPDPETPDAMYRLAALYEERARSDEASDDLSLGLKPAIALYKRVINEFPKYRELAGIFYYLGHAYNDSARTEEAQQVWRSLVCHNKYPYPTPTDPKNPLVDSIMPMPQDGTKETWRAWRDRWSRPGMDPKKLPRNEETTFVDPFTDECQMVAQPSLRPGEDPKFVPEIWWQIGNWEFDQLDARAGVTDDEPYGVWNLNRASSAYTRALKFKKPPLYSVALYKFAWTLFKQQRYDASTREWVKLLLHTDDLEKLQGSANVADFRAEAYTYIAGSLTNVDFLGPAPEEPYIQRPDIVDAEPDPQKAERALHVAIDRVKDPSLVPQDKPWTIEIYKSLAGEFRSLNQFQNAIEVYEMILAKWPMDPTAPEVQNEVALTYDQMNVTGKRSQQDRDALAAKALQARTALASYIGNTPWVDANKENPAAIQAAERLVRGGLRQAASAHTNNGKQLLVLATQAANERERDDDLARSLSEYKLAALGWYGYLRQDENASDAYESRFWLADARNKQLRIQVLMHSRKKDQFPEPTSKEIDDAKSAAIDVRDSNEDDKYLDVVAQFVVEESDIAVDLDYDRYQESKGSQGYPKRVELESTGEGDNMRVKQVPVPAHLLAAMKSRDEYVQRVPPEKDAATDKGVKNATVFQYDVADTYFVYGDFANARARFEPLYKDHCGKDEYGYRAWEKLISMAAKSRDAERARQLAEAEKAHSCAVSDSQRSGASGLTGPIFTEASFVDADRKFIEACGRDIKADADRCDPVTPDRIPKWKDAAKLYNDALEKAPSYRYAPKAAMRAAYSYKQLGDYNSAIKAYDRFISEYGKEELLRNLDKGDSKKGTPPDPKQYAERLQYLNVAYDELGTTYYSFFNYPKAADTFEKVAQIARFAEDKRKTSAKNAMVLFNAIGQRERMKGMYNIVVGLRPSAEEKANYDYLVASFDFKQWSPAGGDGGGNRQSRVDAEQAMAQYYGANKGNTAAAKYALEAAWRVAKMKQSAGDPAYHSWFSNTIEAWRFLDAHASTGKDGKESEMPPFTDYGAEAEFTLLDEEIREKFDYETGHSRYVTFSAADIFGLDTKTGKKVKDGKYDVDAKLADAYDVKLKHVVDTYRSLEFVPAALARRGSLYDTLRTGLYACAGSTFHLFSTEQENILKAMVNSGRDDLIDKADLIKGAVKDGWKYKRGHEMQAADVVMARYYAQAVHLARTYNVRNPAVTRAIARLAFFTDSGTELGEGPKPCYSDDIANPIDKVKQCGIGPFVSGTTDPTDKTGIRKLQYSSGMYVQMRPGLPAALPENGAAAPLPVAP